MTLLGLVIIKEPVNKAQRETSQKPETCGLAQSQDSFPDSNPNYPISLQNLQHLLHNSTKKQ